MGNSRLKTAYHSNTFMVLEFLVFYMSVPFVSVYYLEGWLKILPLLAIALIFLPLLLLDPSFDKKILTRINKAHLRRSVPRMLVISILLLWFTWWIFPHLFFNYPLHDFNSYLITLILYPLVSVIPQELIYRVYFFHRYRKLIPETYLLMLSNAVIFGLTHLIYGNWVAPVATFLVSWIFIFNYLKSKSLFNVSVEHYFYGMVMFTVGFGHYFM